MGKILAKRNKQKLNNVSIPCLFKKIDLPKEDSAIKKVLSQYDGKFALIRDTHSCLNNSYFLAILRVDAGDEWCYYAQRIGRDGTLNEVRMHYHDLEELLVQDHDTAFRHDF